MPYMVQNTEILFLAEHLTNNNLHKMNTIAVKPYSLLTEGDIHSFRAGKHFRLYEKLGSHLQEVEGEQGVYFAVWAPNAKRVGVMGDFNGWNKITHPLNVRWDGSGIWEGFIPELGEGTVYKYFIESNDGSTHEKGDPFAQYWEVPPRTASVVWGLDYKWKDKKWMKNRSKSNALNQPMSVYEVHLGSWKRKLEENNRSFSYKELAKELVAHVKELGFTHVEFMPAMEHPFFGSWGYQICGYFAPSSRYGTPQDFMQLIEAFHKVGIGVILDWVPSHFPGDGHGLYRFDGSALYEHADPRQGYHPDWSSYIFNYGRLEVRSFLISNALFWLDKYHADGLRVDAVASMLYLDYSRKEGEWVPNIHGGRENLEAISFLKELNEEAYGSFPDIQMIAEESTSFPLVSKPTFLGGLGFGMKWMMGWMNDTLEYFKIDTFFRNHHHNTITQSLTYAFTENFMLPLSHDEVVHGKGALLERMPGDEWQRFANLRLLYAYMFTHPGTKLLFMGSEIGQTSEWKHDESLKWDLLQYAPHQGVLAFVKELNEFYQTEKALYEKSFEANGFEWIDYGDSHNCVLSYIRKGENEKDDLVVICNLTPVPKQAYRLGIYPSEQWQEIFNSDDLKYWGSGYKTKSAVAVEEKPWNGRRHSMALDLPPLGMIALKKGNDLVLTNNSRFSSKVVLGS